MLSLHHRKLEYLTCRRIYIYAYGQEVIKICLKPERLVMLEIKYSCLTVSLDLYIDSLCINLNGQHLCG